MDPTNNSHSVAMGYLLWIFGFTGSHRFYYGKQISGTIWLCTGGIFGIGWLIDLFLIPSLDRSADLKYQEGPFNYNVAWILQTFFGYMGFHRFYMGKWVTGLIFLITGGLLTVGWAYDFLSLNSQLNRLNEDSRKTL